MLESIKDIFRNILNAILPFRKDYLVVQKLDDQTINELPKALPIQKIAGNMAENMDWVHPLFHYKDNRVRAIIWELKYKENTKVLEHIGKLLFEEMISLASDIVLFNSDAEFILIPIPITNERRSERGLNQSEYIAKAILENDLGHTFLYAPQWLSKIKETPRQSRSQSKQDRISNLVGTFESDPRVGGKYIILIDDVVTTGSTLSEARKTLLKAGARNVYAFTIAH